MRASIALVAAVFASGCAGDLPSGTSPTREGPPGTTNVISSPLIVTSDVTLTEDIAVNGYGPAIVIGASGVTFDCAGHRVSTTDGAVFWIGGGFGGGGPNFPDPLHDVTVRNCSISSAGQGSIGIHTPLRVWHERLRLIDNTISARFDIAARAFDSEIRGNTLSCWDTCIFLEDGARDNLIAGNRVTGGGIHVRNSEGNVISGNNLEMTGDEFGATGAAISLQGTGNTLVSENDIVDNSLKRYQSILDMFGRANRIVNNRITIPPIEWPKTGISLEATRENLLQGNTITSNGVNLSDGIHVKLWASSDNRLVSNRLVTVGGTPAQSIFGREGSRNNVILDAMHDRSSERLARFDDSSSATVQWFFGAVVRDEAGAPRPDVSVTVTDRVGGEVNAVTGADGRIATQVLSEAVVGEGGRDFNPHTITLRAHDGGTRSLALQVNRSSEVEVVLERATRDVAIDIKPGSDPNSVNCNNVNQVIAVAILTTRDAGGDAADFDALTVDHTSIRFGRNGTEASEIHLSGGGVTRHEEDVDGDGDLDLVLHFRWDETGLQCADTKAQLAGKTFGGLHIAGIDAIRATAQSR